MYTCPALRPPVEGGDEPHVDIVLQYTGVFVGTITFQVEVDFGYSASN